MRVTLLSILKLHFAERAFMRDWHRDHLDESEVREGLGEWNAQTDREFTERLLKKQSSLAVYFGLVAVLVGAGGVVAGVVNAQHPLSWDAVRYIRATALVIVAWAVMGKLDDIKSMGGRTYLERVSDVNFRVLYSLGLFLGGLALFLNGGANGA
jgi:cytochrome c biogenesis protein CcdA